MIVLSIDSSSQVATVALMKDDCLIGEYTLNHKREHSVLIMDMVEMLLKDNNLDINDIDGFVVSKGPGSFTGLRIGMATVKGLSFGSNKPYVSISSLDALAYSLINFDGIICPIMDALRNSVYTCLYKNENGNLTAITDYDALDLPYLVKLIKEKGDKVIFTGDGINKHKDYLKEHLPNAVFAPNHLSIVRASSLGELGIKMLIEGKYDSVNSSPLYLKKPQAERELEKRLALKNGNNL
ncbi:tRNA (adenosine(37)-N6)-threonylcarbamoyltransferase complex dimerization subunit type 1 TsaB [Clostridium septicum]|uniref:tRNA (Adenosine(37)-N6)-threonylcarbamoyltransferase complex dimerization subunit type 1 TsaB n=1 Tax=Clostridium septicum TaxID=1504 RepID=A0A9N7PJG0_CLOSE|nr:tRNA (adenosine(37)-N6)-threonylcarbamoyltransferase complex dimerization subunit type 1 TsaB [Clostridium septicum]AYE34781.1 tRNA (adenosine(37)-N6)-threonylcarbamoyltransferase complex dimerization subunit type 1 TsaB [Clostridium septicum]QAS60176.1 tRNA (adenosine(37)-N6)-threonylcarbamoyltransferase complex dimerization subunit type 1 TsaB [Clostridium septicum]UEC20573.1 tRNA (adenosine(37)-N6)-threonylcarbamoyltransferase complex dimerization subunit type 1 TsaB [Clostridium septicum]